MDDVRLLEFRVDDGVGARTHGRRSTQGGLTGFAQPVLSAGRRRLGCCGQAGVAIGMPVPGQQAVQLVRFGAPRDNAFKHVGEPGCWVDAVQLCGLDQDHRDRPAPRAAVRTCEQRVLSRQGHPGVILPISGKRSLFTTGGIRYTGAGCVDTTASAVLAVTWSTSRWHPAWSRWSRPGCWTRLPVRAWRSAPPGSRLLRWPTCTAC